MPDVRVLTRDRYEAVAGERERERGEREKGGSSAQSAGTRTLGHSCTRALVHSCKREGERERKRERERGKRETFCPFIEFTLWENTCCVAVDQWCLRVPFNGFTSLSSPSLFHCCDLRRECESVRSSHGRALFEHWVALCQQVATQRPTRLLLLRVMRLLLVLRLLRLLGVLGVLFAQSACTRALVQSCSRGREREEKDLCIVH
jgi:hypothetical protein